MTLKILALGGDNIDPEVVDAALSVLGSWTSIRYNTQSFFHLHEPLE